MAARNDLDCSEDDDCWEPTLTTEPPLYEIVLIFIVLVVIMTAMVIAVISLFEWLGARQPYNGSYVRDKMVDQQVSPNPK